MTKTNRGTVTIGIVPMDADPYMEAIPVDDESEGLAALNDIVGGYIESFDAISPNDQVTIYVNERGIPMSLPPNRAVYATKRMAMLGYTSQIVHGMPVHENELYAVLFGDFAIVAHDRQGRMRDLTEEEFHKVADRFFGRKSQESGRREIERMSNEILSQDNPDGIIIIATDEDAADTMQEEATANGLNVKEAKVWTGPIPPDSYQPISPMTRMSTAEFYLLRKTNVDDPVLARLAAIEMLGKYRTKLTCESMPDETYTFLINPRTSKKMMERYLSPVSDTEEAKRTSDIIDTMPEDVTTPLQGWLAVALCMPTELGGYGIEAPLFAAAFENPDVRQTDIMPESMFCPAAYGQYLAYDVIWPDRMIAVQYTGASLPKARDSKALNVDGKFDMIYVTDDMLDDTNIVNTLDLIAEKVLEDIPADMNRDMQRHILELMPKSGCMLMTYDNLVGHL